MQRHGLRLRQGCDVEFGAHGLIGWRTYGTLADKPASLSESLLPSPPIWLVRNQQSPRALAVRWCPPESARVVRWKCPPDLGDRDVASLGGAAGAQLATSP